MCVSVIEQILPVTTMSAEVVVVLVVLFGLLTVQWVWVDAFDYPPPTTTRCSISPPPSLPTPFIR